MEHSRTLPFVAHLDDCDHPTDVLDMLFLERFVAGEHPHARTLKLAAVKADADLVPAGAVTVRTAVDTWRRVVVADGDAWTYRAQRANDASVVLTATGVDEASIEVLLQQVADEVGMEPQDPSRLPVGFWHQGRTGPRRSLRRLDAPSWEDCRRNYSAGVAVAVDALMTADPATLSGRLVLLHGPPGTGKTNLVRALGQAWKSWCTIECVLDPERLLGDSSYLSTVILGDDDDEDEDDDAGSGRPWRLLVLEDCDEVLAMDARQGVGQSLSRLLNLADGLLGQGRRVMVGLTSNEDVTAFHPALVRPGRCLANLHVGLLTADEASAWSGRPAEDWPNGVALAELYAARHAAPGGSPPKRAHLGFRPRRD